jgi:hypothetical protein
MAQTAPWATYTQQAGFPLGVDFRPLLWPLGLFSRLTGAVSSYNLLLLTTPALNVLGGYVLGRRLALPSPASAALGLSLAFPPWVRTTLENGQPEQALLGAGALLLAAVMWAQHGRSPRLILVPIATSLLGIATPHVVLATLVLAGGWLIFAGKPRRGWLGLGLVAGAVAVARYHAPGFDSSIEHFFAPFGLLDASAGPAPKRAIDITELVWKTTIPPGKPPYVVHLGYLGVPLCFATALAARVPAARWTVAGTVACVVLAMGDRGPFGVLAWISPTIAASGTPYRFMLGAVLAASIAAAFTRWGPVVAALSLVESVWADPRPLPFGLLPLPSDPSSLAIRQESGPVLDLPPSGTCRDAAGHYLVEATRHGLPTPLVLRSGGAAYAHDPALSTQLEAALSSGDCARLLAPLLDDYPVVVAHRHRDCLLRETQLQCLITVLGRGHQTPTVAWWVRAP